MEPSVLMPIEDDERNRALRALLDALSECPVRVIETATAQGEALARLHTALTAGRDT